MTKTREKFIIQQRGYYLGGKGYTGGWCRVVRIAPGRIYGSLSAASSYPLRVVGTAQRVTLSKENHNAKQTTTGRRSCHR
jgi:hypothetical protein